MQRIGEDSSDKLDHTLAVFTVERHARGKWVCSSCRSLVKAPVPAEITAKVIPTLGPLVQVLIVKDVDHLSLHRQAHVSGRASLALPRSTLASRVGVCGLRLQPLVDALDVEDLG